MQSDALSDVLQDLILQVRRIISSGAVSLLPDELSTSVDTIRRGRSMQQSDAISDDSRQDSIPQVSPVISSPNFHAISTHPDELSTSVDSLRPRRGTPQSDVLSDILQGLILQVRRIISSRTISTSEESSAPVNAQQSHVVGASHNDSILQIPVNIAGPSTVAHFHSEHRRSRFSGRETSSSIAGTLPEYCRQSSLRQSSSPPPDYATLSDC